MAFIIDRYNHFNRFDKERAVYVFQINEQWYAIKEVELEWGKPILPLSVSDNQRDEHYKIYDTYEDALQFVHTVKSLN